MPASCSICGKDLFVPLHYDGKPICRECLLTTAKNCQKCGNPLNSESIEITDGSVYCESCLNTAQTKTSSPESPISKSSKKTPLGCFVMAGLFFIMIILGFVLDKSDKSGSTSSKQNGSTYQKPKEKDNITIPKSKAVDDITIHSWAKRYVKNQLVSPSTARFPKYYDAKIISEGDDIYEVYSYVDSENRFGAMTRLYYGCTIEVSPNGMSATVLSFAWIQR